MAEVVWTNQARDNLREIAEFISKKAPARAEPQVRRLYETAERLRDFPHSGRIVPELNDQSFRELVVDDYRVVYRNADSTVHVLAVLHGRQDFQAFWNPDDD